MLQDFVDAFHVIELRVRFGAEDETANAMKR